MKLTNLYTYLSCYFEHVEARKYIIVDDEDGVIIIADTRLV